VDRGGGGFGEKVAEGGMTGLSTVKNSWLSLLWVSVTYILAADLAPSLLLLAVNSLGYLPYSDRPGPGWQGPHLPSKGELQFFFGFAVVLLRGTAFYAALFAFLSRVLGVCRVPRWSLRLVATPLAIFSSGIMMAAAGWLIAISPLGVYTAAICGGTWGLLIFPRLIPKIAYVPPLPIRVIVPVLLFVIGGYWLIRPLLPNQSLTNAKVEIIRRDGSGGPPFNLEYLGPGFEGSVGDANTYFSVSRLEFTTSGRNQARVLLVVDDPIPVPHTFVLPRTGVAVFRQSNGIWKEEQRSGRQSDISVAFRAFNSTLEPQWTCPQF
jgi:hypothetical protein